MKKHNISNSYLSVEILEEGAEICSIKTNSSQKEFMWNANPNVWGSYAPVLFPIIGALKNGETSIDGKEYAIPKHGFIRYNKDLKVNKVDDSTIQFILDYSNKTLEVYPYKFRFVIQFSFEQNRLLVSHEVENLDQQSIYFSLGGHPAFKCPINANEKLTDYYIEFEEKEVASTTLLSESGLISDQEKLMLDNTNKLPITLDLFDNDALIFKSLKSKEVSLKSKKSSSSVKLNFKEFPYLGIWAKPQANFVCLEPWIGIADHENTNGEFKTKDQLVSLDKGNMFKASYWIEVND